MAQMDKNSKRTTRLSSDVPAAPGRERREPSDSIQFFPDSREQIEDSIERTGLRSLLDETFQAAIQRAKGEQLRKNTEHTNPAK